MNRFVLFLSVFLLAGAFAGFPGARALAASPVNDAVVLESKDIALLSDEKLVDAYIDVLAELEAIRTFHATSGFAPKEFKKYKDLIKSRIQINIEIHRRKLEIPAL